MLQAIKDLTVNGVSPSYDELAARCGTRSRGGVFAQLNRLRDKGRITWDPGRARSIEVLDEPLKPAEASPERLRGYIEDAAETLAALIGPTETADFLRKLKNKHQWVARQQRGD